jgi:ABC-2 type transport system ATP-binding protein
MRILFADSGHIRVLSEENFDAANDRIGYLPEERGLYKKMKVRDLLVFFANLKGCRESRKQANQWLEKLSLAEWANKPVDALSKGMAQKVQFISAVVARPELLILDEPFTGLDPVNADLLKDAVIELRQQGTTILFSTHDMEVAEKMCDFICMVFRGRKVLDGTLESIQGEYGSDVIRVRVDGDNNASKFGQLTGVQQVNDFGRSQELRIDPEADTQQVLSELMSLGRVKQFELVRPRLRDIFMRIAGPEASDQ